MAVGEVVSQDEWFYWSLTQLSREFGIARETVSRRLAIAGVDSSRMRRGYSVYRVMPAAKAILMPPSLSGDTLNDPEKMSPKERADWFKSENERLKFERDSGISVYSDDAREQMAVIAKTGLQVLETLPDVLERDFNLDTEIIIGIENKIDELRTQWANLLGEIT